MIHPKHQASARTGLWAQCSHHIMMVRPVRFGYNAQTAESNAFQHRPEVGSADSIQRQAQAEFDEMVRILQQAGVQVTVFEDTPEPHTPDSIFPNNWISTHSNGKVIVYPIMAPNRQAEKRDDIIQFAQSPYPHPEVIDLSYFQSADKYLEGTGSMIMDRAHQLVYACISPRTTPEVFDIFCQHVECEGILFPAADAQGQEIYHTNVMMALADRVAVICLEAIQDIPTRKRITDRLEGTGHEIVEITFAQMNAFAGNMLQVRNEKGDSFIVMSQRARQSLRTDQVQA
ncbi:MAG: arginine deiminase-related protein, partial [Bacteroidota bacterium]